MLGHDPHFPFGVSRGSKKINHDLRGPCVDRSGPRWNITCVPFWIISNLAPVICGAGLGNTTPSEPGGLAAPMDNAGTSIASAPERVQAWRCA
jgi:hypothetical protein